MSSLVRFGISIEAELLQRFDALIRHKGYTNRSEAIRDLMRDNLVHHEWEDDEGEKVGTITLIYDHHVRELSEKLTSMQHANHDMVISTMHVHLDHHTCLEVLAVKGKVSNITAVADALIGTKGVKHGKLVMTTSGAI